MVRCKIERGPKLPESPEVEHVKRDSALCAQSNHRTCLVSDKVIDGKASGRDTIIKQIDLSMFKIVQKAIKLHVWNAEVSISFCI